MRTHATATFFIGAKISTESWEEKYGERNDADDVYVMKIGLVSPWKSYDPPRGLTSKQLDEYYDKWKEYHSKELKEYRDKKYEMIKASGCRIGFSGDEYLGYSTYIMLLDKTSQLVRCREIVKIDPNEWKVTEEMKTKIKEFAQALELSIGDIGFHVEVSSW